jgi:hypothetical protein
MTCGQNLDTQGFSGRVAPDGLLTPQQNGQVQRWREVLYLYFAGKDGRWLERMTDVEFYGFYGDLSAFHSPAERAARIADLRPEMLPLRFLTEWNIAIRRSVNSSAASDFVAVDLPIAAWSGLFRQERRRAGQHGDGLRAR